MYKNKVCCTCKTFNGYMSIRNIPLCRYQPHIFNIIYCPCINCLVKIICEQACEKYNKFLRYSSLDSYIYFRSKKKYMSFSINYYLKEITRLNKTFKNGKHVSTVHGYIIQSSLDKEDLKYKSAGHAYIIKSLLNSEQIKI